MVRSGFIFLGEDTPCSLLRKLWRAELVSQTAPEFFKPIQVENEDEFLTILHETAL